MSRQEIDRILNNDITEIETHISKKIQTIDQITDQLALKSNFLAQFQLLLQQQLSIPSANQNTESQLPNSKQQVEQSNFIESECNQYQPSLDLGGLGIENGQNRKQSFQQQDQVAKAYEKVEYLSQKLKKLLQNQQFLAKSLRSCFQTVRSTFQQLLKTCKEDLIHITEHLAQQVVKSIKKEYDAQVSQLKSQNYSLREEIQFLKTQKNPLKELTFNQLQINDFQDFTVTQKLNNKSALANEANFNSTASHHKMSYKADRAQRSKKSSESIYYQPPKPQQQWIIQQKRLDFEECTKIPLIKPIKVGVPPLKQGFGILKSGNKVIYKGMWSKGKFQGKGKLQWQNYIYEGEFKSGLFAGYGILQINDSRYIGRFEENKAEGEGTLQFNNIRKYGFWRQNELVKQY